MTAFDRLERDIPTLMDELAPARVPDYFDDMLRATARTRQRPAWSSLERWLPMGVIARPLPIGRFPTRSLAILLIVGALIATGLLVYAGTRPRLPDPFGPARNGQMVIVTTDGNIAGVDPATGTMRTIVEDPASDLAPWVSHDGQRLLFARDMGGGEALFVVGMDGSNVRQVFAPGATLSWYDWSPDDARAIVTYPVAGYDVLAIVDVASGESRVLDVGMSVHEPQFRPNGREIVFRGDGEGAVDGLYLVNDDGTGLRPILATTSGADDDWRRTSLSPDGTKVAFDRWMDAGAVRGRIHIVDVDTGRDAYLAIGSLDDEVEGQPVWSPDSSQLAILWFHPGNTIGFRVATLPVAGGPATMIGPEHNGDLNMMYSPDGTKIIANYGEDDSTWLLEPATGRADRVDWPVKPSSGWGWQRLAQ